MRFFRLKHRMVMVAVLLALAGVCRGQVSETLHTPSFSTAGFHVVEPEVRTAINFNPGSAEGAEQVDFDDSDWPVVNLPNGLEILPLNASGSINYQGEAWYRKHVVVPADLKDRKLFLHFEGIMGRCMVLTSL